MGQRAAKQLQYASNISYFSEDHLPEKSKIVLAVLVYAYVLEMSSTCALPSCVDLSLAPVMSSVCDRAASKIKALALNKG